ncbi:MAG TPA: protease HtpX [Candidatus Melainabacteria bacterium]|jgi:heat shock protein HtpX|nr:protease HtpX [Candidatus Melainabacteria bacterium]HIN64613.1 protease HtpX [Candidatus Obscuribacterales bacterium]
MHFVNTLKTLVFMGILTALIVVVGGIFGGKSGMMIAFVFACVMNIGSYWFSDKIALAAHGAQPIAREQAPVLYEIIERLAAKAGIPVPPIYLIPTDSPNAFATGRDPEHSAVAVTAGILKMLSESELEGVLAHELGHVKNRDVLLTTIAAVLAGVVTMIAQNGIYFMGSRDEDGPNPIVMLVAAILAPIAATLINLAISRSREYEADATGAEMCGKPLELADALAKIERGAQVRPMTDANPAYASLYISNPFPQNWLVNLMSTHPPTQERIFRLQQIARKMHTH